MHAPEGHSPEIENNVRAIVTGMQERGEPVTTEGVSMAYRETYGCPAILLLLLGPIIDYVIQRIMRDTFGGAADGELEP